MATKAQRALALNKAAEAICAAVPPASLPHEILVLAPDTLALVLDIEGVDYVLSMSEVPQQRRRPRPA